VVRGRGGGGNECKGGWGRCGRKWGGSGKYFSGGTGKIKKRRTIHFESVDLARGKKPVTDENRYSCAERSRELKAASSLCPLCGEERPKYRENQKNQGGEKKKNSSVVSNVSLLADATRNLIQKGDNREKGGKNTGYSRGQ